MRGAMQLHYVSRPCFVMQPVHVLQPQTCCHCLQAMRNEEAAQSLRLGGTSPNAPTACPAARVMRNRHLDFFDDTSKVCPGRWITPGSVATRSHTHPLPLLQPGNIRSLWGLAWVTRSSIHPRCCRRAMEMWASFGCMLEKVCHPAKLRAQYLARVRGDPMNCRGTLFTNSGESNYDNRPPAGIH